MLSRDWQSDKGSLPSAVHRYMKPPQGWVGGSKDPFSTASGGVSEQYYALQALLRLTRVSLDRFHKEAALEAGCTVEWTIKAPERTALARK